MVPARHLPWSGLQSLVHYLCLNLVTSLQTLLIFMWILCSSWEVTSQGIGSYAWYAGEWKPCQSNTCGGLGTTHRPVVCTETRTNATVHATLCAGIPHPPSSQKQCLRICDFHRYQYKWQASPWSPCRHEDETAAAISSKATRCKDGHYYGVQTRNISCVARCSGQAPSEIFCSVFQPRPLSSRVCSIQCPKDCITSEYGSWTKCDSCFRRYKSRYKTVLRAPTDDGVDCETLADHEPCELKQECFDNRVSNFLYRLGEWTKCSKGADGKLRRKIRQFSNILAHQTREVDCIDVHGTVVDERICSFNSRRPADNQLCVIPRDCLVSHWTNWANWTSDGLPYPLATSRNNPHRTRDQEVLTRDRNLIQVPHGEGGACPMLIDRKEKKAEDSEPAEPCDRYTWLEGEWGKCEPQLKTDHCGIGTQTRTVVCVRVTDKVPVPDYQCATAAPVHTQLCERQCTSDCQVSSWGSWGECLPEICTKSSNNKPGTGYRSRRRYIINTDPPPADESACPHLEESQQCEFPVCYRWVSDGNLPAVCVVRYKGMTCGEGVLKTHRKCVDIRGERVSDSLCPYVLQPESCHVPCGRDCVLSQWSPWSDCPDKCDPYGQVHYRTRTKHVLAQPSQEGVQCPPEKQRQELSRCPRHSCERYHWKATPWGQCRLKAKSKLRELGEDRDWDTNNAVNHVTCGPGTQERDVYCYREDGRNTADKKCPENRKPELTRDCVIPCSDPCQVSMFSDWSDCSASCHSDTAPTPIQKRTRFVLSTGHSQACPYLEEVKECKHLPRCETYQWETSDWSSCLTLKRCGEGYRAREVICMNQRGDKLPEEMCISLLGSKPLSAERCEVGSGSCQDTCVFSEWTEWSACSQRCNGVRKRWRSMEGDSSKITLCHDSSKYPLQQKQLCNPCKHFNEMPVGRWSSCILNATHPKPPELVPLSTLKSNRYTCGIGNRYQALVCNDGQGHNISAAACYSKEFVEEVCFTPCPLDCVLSQWSEWTHCTTKNRCGNGRRTRNRYIKELALDGGRSCIIEGDEQYDHHPCHIPCETYFWQAGEWSECSVQVRLAKTQPCGTGIKFRTIRCMRQPARPGEEPAEVSVSHCDFLHKPHTDSNCSVPCPGHCVMSEWSEWTKCSLTCSGKRHRTRAIARQPSPGIGASCGEPRQVEDCSLGTNCFEYSLAWSDWGECILPAERHCGIGYRVSYSECVRSDRTPVHREYCLQPGEDLSTMAKMMKEVCEVPCPVDCVVSEWTVWSRCSLSCGLGYQERFRHVVIPPRHNGRECPRELSQERPCPYTECFHWRVSEWGECEIPESSCGFGTQTRSLACYRRDGLPVNQQLCPQGERTHYQLTRSCRVSCPGDCWVSHWSEWGICDRPCVLGITEGVQTRSRAIISLPNDLTKPCPYNLIETRPCSGGPCHTYRWQTSYWYGDRRNVWCERSDKVTVFGGCDLGNRPASFRRCSPPCSVEFSTCVDINRCACESGYSATYHEVTGKLVRCTTTVPRGRGMSPTSHNNTSERVESKQFLPEDGSTNFWMYAVIAAGSAFIIFVVIAVYFILKHSRRDQLNEMSLRSHGSTIQRKHHTVKSSTNDGLSDKTPSPSKLKAFITRTENEYT